jgi:hypothetical protein
VGIEVWVGYDNEEHAVGSVVRSNLEDALATARRFRQTALASGYGELEPVAAARPVVAPDRRMSPRSEPTAEARGRSVPLQTPITLLNISRTGMAIRMGIALPVDTSQRFQLHLEDGTVLKLLGNVVRCEPQEDDYIIGVHFACPLGDVLEDIIRGKTAEYG